MYSVREAAILGSPATGTPQLSGSVVRSISAGTTVSLAVQDPSVRISVPYIAGNTLITTGATTLTTQIVYGGFVTVSGTPPFTPYTITLPSPVTAPGAQFELMMDVGIPITITTPAGWIGGVSGSYESTKVLTAATVGPHNRFYSDGPNWNMLSVSGYTSGGDLTATRVNAGSFAINNTNITTIFAPRASPTFTGLTTVATLTTSGDLTANGRVFLQER